MAAADKFDMAAKQCAASASTQQFALALESGEVVRFDNNGDAKATEALRTVDVQTGKKIKATVTGIMEANNTVRVVSVEVKAKKSKTSSMAGEQ
jgi:citrate lyase gamma subunit